MAKEPLPIQEIPNYIFLSHHPKEKSTSPCASIYQAFIGPDRICDLAGYANVSIDKKRFDKALQTQLSGNKDPHFLFNGFQSLLLPNSIKALEIALDRGIPVTIYWHETAWNLRFLAQREANNFRKASELLQCLDLVNWVPTSQCLHSVATLFGFPLETFRIVYEVVNLESFNVLDAAKKKKGQCETIVVAGAGVPDDRKGIDIFSYIAETVRHSTSVNVEFRWYAATPNRRRNDNVPYPDAIKWMGHREDFHDALKEVDIFLLTSRDDPSPLVVFEALATGIPSYAFATTGFNEMLPQQYVALSPNDMCRRVVEEIENYTPNPQYFRAIAEGYNVESFKHRAFGIAGDFLNNLPPLETEPIELFSEEDKEQLQQKIDLLDARYFKLLKVMKSLKRERIQFGKQYRKLERIDKERTFYKNVSQSLASRLKTSLYCKNAGSPPSEKLLNGVHKSSGLRVLVIGNAPSVLNWELGDKIDEFDVIIRINNFRVSGYERFIGSKTSAAVISPACMESSELKSLPLERVFVFGANLRNNYLKITERLSEEVRGCKVVPPEENILQAPIYVDGLRMEMGLDVTKGIWPTTGIATIAWAVDVFQSYDAEIYVHGFDFYSDNRSKLTRYFNVTTEADGKHDFDAEKEYMKSLLRHGVIKMLAFPCSTKDHSTCEYVQSLPVKKLESARSALKAGLLDQAFLISSEALKKNPDSSMHMKVIEDIAKAQHAIWETRAADLRNRHLAAIKTKEKYRKSSLSRRMRGLAGLLLNGSSSEKKN